MKPISLVLFCLFLAVSVPAQTAKKHVNLGMDIDEFAERFDVSGSVSRSRETSGIDSAVREAMTGRRITIQMDLEGRKTAFVFDKRTLCEIEVTAFNTYAHELQVLTDQLGTSHLSDAKSTIWDRGDGTRFTLTSRSGTGVLRITPTPSGD